MDPNEMPIAPPVRAKSNAPPARGKAPPGARQRLTRNDPPAEADALPPGKGSNTAASLGSVQDNLRFSRDRFPSKLSIDLQTGCIHGFLPGTDEFASNGLAWQDID